MDPPGPAEHGVGGSGQEGSSVGEGTGPDPQDGEGGQEVKPDLAC